MTHYVLTRGLFGEVPAGSVGRIAAVRSTDGMTVVTFQGHRVTMPVESLMRATMSLRPMAWKAAFRFRTGRVRRMLVPADPVTYDPPSVWRVPVPNGRPVLLRDVGPDIVESPMEAVTFRCSHIPESSDTWFYEPDAPIPGVGHA